MKRHRIRNAFLCLAFIALAAIGILALRSYAAVDKAEQLIQHGFWDAARRELNSYFWLHPHDGRARLLMAESLVRDDRLPARQSVPAALEQLQHVKDDSTYAARARTEQGRLEFLLLHKPAAAEKLFRRACDLDPALASPDYMLWKLFELTGRAHLASDVFWKMYELTPADQQPQRLREWYISQFYPGTATRALDQQMGFLTAPEESLSKIEARRFFEFRKTEPHAPLGHAALASWFRIKGNPQGALETLEEGMKKATGALQDEYFVTVLVATLMDLGEFERAQYYFDRWPEPRQGYEYLLAEAIVLDEIKQRPEDAASCYEEASHQWPGPVDWRTRFRYANCLARVGQMQAADRVRDSARKIEEYMREEAQAPVVAALDHLDDAHSLGEIVTFYRRLDCQREADAWQEVLQRVKAQPGRAFPSSSPTK